METPIKHVFNRAPANRDALMIKNFDTIPGKFSFDAKDVKVRIMNLGNQPAGFYTDRSRATYWAGRNVFGESEVSGVYFYALKAGEFTAMRKLLIREYA